MQKNIDYTPQEIAKLAEPIFEDMANRNVPAEETALARKAFEFACKAHANQRRKSGHPYIVHPIAVASIVGIEMQLGAAPVCAAFLHDVVEDTDCTSKDIERVFGADVAFLVDAVTKNKKEQFDTSVQVQAFGKLLSAINYDIRALLLKLADRLHNMRTLASMTSAKQMKIAGETDYFYAPLANRLGLYRVKIELENLSFRYRCPREFNRLEKMIEDDIAASRPMLQTFMDKVKETLKADGIDVLVEAEYRRPFSIRRKMLKTGKDFSHLDSRYFVRVVFPDNQRLSEKEMALHIYSLLSDVFNEQPRSIINYIDSPKENGYQSLHVNLLSHTGQWIEVHISSTAMRRVSRLGCIADRTEGNIGRWIDRLKSTLEDISKHKHEIGFMEGVTTSFYNDDITVYTPAGEAIMLPQKATALDFAFEVNPNLGMHAQYARINGKLCSIKTSLHRGDCVEIGTSPRIAPKPEWLDHVRTYTATRKIKSYLAHRPEPAMYRCNHCHPLPGDEVIGFKDDNGKVMVHKRDCPMVISQASQHGDHVLDVTFNPDTTLYPVSLQIIGIDRFHLVSDIIDCISNKLRLSMYDVRCTSEDEIANCEIEFAVHSYRELQTVIDAVNAIPGVDQVSHKEG